MQIYRISIESNEKYKYSQKGNKLNTFLHYNGMASLLNYLFIYWQGMTLACDWWNSPSHEAECNMGRQSVVRRSASNPTGKR